MTQRLWGIEASEAELEAIENLLQECGETITRDSTKATIVATSVRQVLNELSRACKLPWPSTRRRCGTPARGRVRWLNHGQGERALSGWVVDVPERPVPPEQAIDVPAKYSKFL